MKKIVLGAALSALSLGIPTVAHAQKAPASVIVVVDTDRVYRECTACVAAQGQLQALVTSSRTRAEQLGQPLQTEAQSIEQAGAALRNQTGSARTSGETALNARVQAFQQKQTAAQQELAQLGPDASNVPATLQGSGDPVQLLLAEAQRQPQPVARWLQQQCSLFLVRQYFLDFRMCQMVKILILSYFFPSWQQHRKVVQ